MNKKLLLLALIAVIGIQSCVKDEQEVTDAPSIPLDSFLIGEWQVTAVLLEYESLANVPDSNLVVDMLNDTTYKTNHTIRYYPNDTYEIQFEGSEDVLTGVWNLIGDTTLVRVEDNAFYEYSIERNSNTINQQSLEDLDGDGVKDDYFKSSYTKIN